MSTELANHSEFVEALAGKITISAGENKTLVSTKIEDCEIHVERDASATVVAFITDGWEEVKKLNFHFDDENCDLTFIGIIVGTGEAGFPLEAISNHHVPNTNGYYYIRSAMFDKSKIDFRGNIIIEKGAQHTDSYLAHHSLMMSPNAHTDTEPCLEIEADDVAAGHAATVGRVDESLLFYLQSRGLSREESQELLIKGFMQEDFEKISNTDLRESLEHTLEKYLEEYVHARSKKD